MNKWLSKYCCLFASSTVGTVVLALGTVLFYFPFDIVAGGVGGLGIALSLFFGGRLSAALISSVLGVILFLVGWILLGGRFALGTLASALIFPLASLAFERLLLTEPLRSYFILSFGDHPELAPLVAAALGGVTVGFGVGLAMRGGASTGGSDIIVFVLAKYFPRIRISHIAFFVDGAVVLIGAFAVGDFMKTLLGIGSALLGSIVTERVMLSGSRAFIAEIISDEWESISKRVVSDMHRTTTLLSATGGYTGAERHVVRVGFAAREYATLRRIIEGCDPSSFVTVYHAREIRGEGWGL